MTVWLIGGAVVAVYGLFVWSLCAAAARGDAEGFRPGTAAEGSDQ